MKAHEAARKLVEVEKLLGQADELCTSPGVIDLIRQAKKIVYSVGDGMYPEIIKELRKDGML